MFLFIINNTKLKMKSAPTLTDIDEEKNHGEEVKGRGSADDSSDSRPSEEHNVEVRQG